MTQRIESRAAAVPGPEGPGYREKPRERGYRAEARSRAFFGLARPFRAGACALLLLALPACQQQMGTTPAYKPLTTSDFFADGRASRPLITGTVARGQLHDDPILTTGRDDHGELSDEFPFPMTKETLTRGRERYDIFCSVCHGLTGHGDGRIVQRGFTRPPNLIADLSRGYKLRGETKKLTDVPVGYVYEVVTKGYGAMPDYASQIPTADRWAIVGYVKALQYSQSADLRQKLRIDTEKGAKK